MDTILLICILIFAFSSVILCVFIVIRQGRDSQQEPAFTRPFLDAIKSAEGGIREELGKNRAELSDSSTKNRQELAQNLSMGLSNLSTLLNTSAENGSQQSKSLREEVQATVSNLGESLRSQTVELAKVNSQLMATQAEKVEQQTVAVTNGLDKIRLGLDERLVKFQQSNSEDAIQVRKEMGDALRGFSDTMHNQFTVIAGSMSTQFDLFGKQILALTKSNEEKMEAIRQSVDTRLLHIQEDNGKRLEEMRKTVDEKLHATLETRLGESFKLVSDRLELVHQGLGEMKSLGAGVGDLKKVLTNVKSRGILGEIMLGSLLEQMLSPEQFEKDACVKTGSAERVEYAVKLPGYDADRSHIYLSIDSKFPQEDYQRLQDAYEQGNVEQIEVQAKQLEGRIKAEGKKIREKYINPPETCDFAIMFLPTEGLFAEVLRRPGLHEYLQRECKVTICGPTNLAGFLNSLSMGFRTLAIAKKSSEVWSTLSVVKAEFGKFSDLLDGIKKKLVEATNKIDAASSKSRTIEKRLKGVEALPATDITIAGELAFEALPEILAHVPNEPEVN